MSIDNTVSKRLAGLLFCLALAAPQTRLQSRNRSPGNPAKQVSVPNALLDKRPFLQIPGPKPIIVRGGKGAWDEDVIEACDVFKNFETYYFYYHGVPRDRAKWGVLGYRVGLATAKRPLGPWVKYGDQPVLDLGPQGSWEDKHVASSFVLKEKPGKFVMWYSGMGKSGIWGIGIATASKPEGPWQKYENNPIIPNFGYVGGVVKLNGTYYLYTEHPIGSTAPDYGPISLATAPSPEGPWTIWDHNPVLAAGPPGAWDDMRVHVRSSADGLDYDSTDFLAFDNHLLPGGIGGKTISLQPGVRFIKVVVENTGKSALADYEVVATISR